MCVFVWVYVKQEDGGECLLHLYERREPESSWHVGVGQRLFTAHLHKDWTTRFRYTLPWSPAIVNLESKWSCGCNCVFVLCVSLQVLPTASSWTCCFQGAYWWKKSNSMLNWNMNTSTISRSYRLLSRGWMWTRWAHTHAQTPKYSKSNWLKEPKDSY